jgi:hypothetical protein
MSNRKHRNFEDVILWIECKDKNEYNTLQKILVDNGHQWLNEDYFDYGNHIISDIKSYRPMSDKQFILPNMFISLYSDGVIEFNHSICGISPIISSTMYINKRNRKLKLERLKND